MRALMEPGKIEETVKTMRFLIVVVFVTGALASSVGATAGAYVLVSAFPGSHYGQKWLDWFVGDVSGRQVMLGL